MFKADAELRSQGLYSQLSEILDQCRLGLNLLHANPYANINLNLLHIDNAVTECREIILVYVKE